MLGSPKLLWESKSTSHGNGIWSLIAREQEYRRAVQEKQLPLAPTSANTQRSREWRQERP
jgi:hypothetical protein